MFKKCFHSILLSIFLRCSNPLEKLVIFNNESKVIEPIELEFEKFKKSGWVCNHLHEFTTAERCTIFSAVDDWWGQTSERYNRKL